MKNVLRTLMLIISLTLVISVALLMSSSCEVKLIRSKQRVLQVSAITVIIHGKNLVLVPKH